MRIDVSRASKRIFLIRRIRVSRVGVQRTHHCDSAPLPTKGPSRHLLVPSPGPGARLCAEYGRQTCSRCSLAHFYLTAPAAVAMIIRTRLKPTMSSRGVTVAFRFFSMLPQTVTALVSLETEALEVRLRKRLAVLLRVQQRAFKAAAVPSPNITMLMDSERLVQLTLELHSLSSQEREQLKRVIEDRISASPTAPAQGTSAPPCALASRRLPFPHPLSLFQGTRGSFAAALVRPLTLPLLSHHFLQLGHRFIGEHNSGSTDDKKSAYAAGG